MVLPFLSLMTVPMRLLEGFAFGTGYGAGVKFGYQDVYPALKTLAGDILRNMGLNIGDVRGFADSGFGMSSGNSKEINSGTGFNTLY